MLGAGTIINPIIKIVTTVIILGAVYLFFVKPALDTTENITDSINESISGSFDSFDDVAEEASEFGIDVEEPQGEKQQNKLFNCFEDAGQNKGELQRCAQKFGS